jgi:hypothetical protein
MIGVTFYHSSQYLAITYSYYLREKALEKSADAPRRLAFDLCSQLNNLLPQSPCFGLHYFKHLT